MTNVGEDMEKLELLFSAGRNVNWCGPSGKWHGNSSKN